MVIIPDISQEAFLLQSGQSSVLSSFLIVLRNYVRPRNRPEREDEGRTSVGHIEGESRPK